MNKKKSNTNKNKKITAEKPGKAIFDEMESAVQSYARAFPEIFVHASGARIRTREGREYIDFLAGAGSLNYGHNNLHLQEALIDYIQSGGITHSLDFHTEAKEDFLHTFRDLILKPRGMEYVVQFTGPTGANAVEAALKIARKVKNRTQIIAFTNGFHGVTTGALAATGNAYHRGGAGMPLSGVIRMPYEGYMEDMDTIAYMERLLSDASSGIDLPAAVLVETVQGEGGLTAASATWLRALQKLCRKYDMLLIVDDIQAGCGRTGSFFSFEGMGISPDIITLSKSLSGYGLPFAVTLFKPEHDQWKPGEHNGTFRGNNHAFVTATAALRRYWHNDSFAKAVKRKGDLVAARISEIISAYPEGFLSPRGRGMMRGIVCPNGDIAGDITKYAFEKGLIVETSGADGEVVKCLCPLTISEEDLQKGWDILESGFHQILEEQIPDRSQKAA